MIWATAWPLAKGAPPWSTTTRAFPLNRECLEDSQQSAGGLLFNGSWIGENEFCLTYLWGWQPEIVAVATNQTSVIYVFLFFLLYAYYLALVIMTSIRPFQSPTDYYYYWAAYKFINEILVRNSCFDSYRTFDYKHFSLLRCFTSWKGNYRSGVFLCCDCKSIPLFIYLF